MGKCIVIGAGLNIAPARLALINSDVNDGDLIILVGLSGDALGALAEFTSQVYQDLGIKVEQFILNPRASLIDNGQTSPFMAGLPHYVGFGNRFINFGFVLCLVSRGCPLLVNTTKMGSGG
jgi:hypothetical protein